MASFFYRQLPLFQGYYHGYYSKSSTPTLIKRASIFGKQIVQQDARLARGISHSAILPKQKSMVKNDSAELGIDLEEDKLELIKETSVSEYAMRMMKVLESEEKLKIKRRSTWFIRRHVEIVERFCKSPKQVLGLSLKEYKKRVDMLQRLEISHQDALVIALTYPACLSLESPTMFEMVAFLKEFGCYLPKHFMKNYYVFSLDAGYCRSNVEHLKGIGLTSENIGSLIDINPIVLTVPLSKEVEEFAVNAKNYKSSNNILRLAMKTSLLKPGELISQNEDFEEIVSFLHELKVNLPKLMQKCPEFLCTNYNQLVETYQFLSGAPLYCEKNHIKKLLESDPHNFLQMNKSIFQQSITNLSKIVDSNEKLYFLLQKSPMLFVDSSSILLERIEMLQNYQFSQHEIIGLLERAAFLFMGKESSDRTKKLHLFLSNKDITANQVYNSAFVLKAPLDRIQNRLFFIRNKKPDVLEKHSLKEIVFSSNKVFISEICKSSLKVYLDTVELADTSFVVG